MIKIRQYGSAGTIPDEPAVALFGQQWQLYRKFVDNNLLHHREVYNQLHRILGALPVDIWQLGPYSYQFPLPLDTMSRFSLN